MPRIILLLAIVIALALLVRRIQAMPPHKRRSGYVQLILGAAALAAIVLTAMGKMHWVDRLVGRSATNIAHTGSRFSVPTEVVEPNFCTGRTAFRGENRTASDDLGS